MSKRVVIDGKESDWYSQAIFFLRDEHVEKKNINFKEHAEKLIETYMKTTNRMSLKDHKANKISGESTTHTKTAEQNYRWIDIFFVASLVFLTIVIILYFL